MNSTSILSHIASWLQISTTAKKAPICVRTLHPSGLVEDNGAGSGHLTFHPLLGLVVREWFDFDLHEFLFMMMIEFGLGTKFGSEIFLEFCCGILEFWSLKILTRIFDLVRNLPPEIPKT